MNRHQQTPLEKSCKQRRPRKKGVKLGRPVSSQTGDRVARPALVSKHPLHITLRLREGLPNLRTRKGAQLVGHALRGLKGKGVRVIHFAVLSNHIHMLVEIPGRKTFFHGMKSFTCRLSRGLRQLGSPKRIAFFDKKGWGLFLGRYHVSVLVRPSQVKNALRYVLLNPCKHFKKAPYIDQFTSAFGFKHWKKLLGHDLSLPRATINPEWIFAVESPKLWSLIEGWQRGR